MPSKAMEIDHMAADTAAAASSPTSNGYSPATKNAGRKRQRSHATPDGSPVSHTMDDAAHESADEKRRQTGKRACNECRQQKLRCDVNPAPFETCSRCKRLNLDCRIDANFKRIGKRSKNAEMEREIIELRKRLADKDSPMHASSTAHSYGSAFSSPAATLSLPTQPNSLDALHAGIAGSLLDLRHSSNLLSATKSKAKDPRTKTLADVTVTGDKIDALFDHYFAFYHPFLPLLDPDKPADSYYDQSPLLFWTIVAVAARRWENDPTLLTGLTTSLPSLLWSTISAVPQNYHVVKALCLICSWPLPTKSTSTDPSFMLVGVMMQIAMQIGLHRPSHIQDFSRIRIEVREDDLRDRVKTWAACNIVAQSVSTGYGQPPKTVYDWTLMSPLEGSMNSFSLPPELIYRLMIERFCNKVTQKFYNNRSDPIGVTSDQERAAWTSLLVESYQAIEHRITANAQPIDILHLRAAYLHLRLSAFFDAPSAPNYIADLLELYLATTSFIECALNFKVPTIEGQALKYATNYIMQMLVAGGFTLLKLLNSFFAKHIDVESARRLFNLTIWAIRAISVTNNDLPGRLAEVLAQLWRAYGAGTRQIAASDAAQQNSLENLQLKVRCRMSMSLVFDSIWRWREEFQFSSGSAVNLDSAVNNPTNPDVSGTDRSAEEVANGNGAGATAAAAAAAASSGTKHASFLDPALSSDLTTATTTSTSSPSLASRPLRNQKTLAKKQQQSDPSHGLGSTTPLLYQATAADTALAASSNPVLGFNGSTTSGIEDYSYEVFDPLTWMLDGDVDFPYGSSILGDEGLGMGSMGMLGLGSTGTAGAGNGNGNAGTGAGTGTGGTGYYS